MLAAGAALLCWRAAAQGPDPADLLRTEHEVGRAGGRLVFALRTEPKTLNPVTAVDSASRDVIGRMAADLVHIDRQTQQTTPALAKSWSVSSDGRRYTLELRRGLRFSDGHPLDADDVVFSFQCYLDERNGSSQRDLLVVGGKPAVVRKLDTYQIAFEIEQPYAAAERLFDSFAILPRHLLAKAQQEGRLPQAWTLSTPPAEIAGLGPFRLRSYVPGDRLVLERNPYYWKVDGVGRPLPYLDEIVFLLVPSEDAQVIRFKAGETDLISRLSAENFTVLAREQGGRLRLEDLGPGLEYSFLFFNLNDLPPGRLDTIARKQAWFSQTAFRQAVSATLDREGMVQLVYQGRAVPLASHVTPGNKLWLNRALPPPARSLARARDLLARAGFSWKDGTLRDGTGSPVEFTIVTNAANTALMALGSGDADPNGEMNVWLSNGATHLWHLGQSRPATSWEQEIDELMRRQLVTRDASERKRLYDRVQALVAENLPLIPLVSPDVLVGTRARLGNFRPAVLDHNVLWNADELFWRP